MLKKHGMLMVLMFCMVNVIDASRWENIRAYEFKRASILPIVYNEKHNEIQVILKKNNKNKKSDFTDLEIGKILELSDDDIADFIKNNIKGCVIMVREDNKKEESHRGYVVTYIVGFDSENAVKLLSRLGQWVTFAFWDDLLKSVSNNDNALGLQLILADIVSGIKEENKNTCDNNLPLGLFIFGMQREEGKRFFYQKPANTLLTPEEIEIFCQKIHYLFDGKNNLISNLQPVVIEEKQAELQSVPKEPRFSEIVIDEKNIPKVGDTISPRMESLQKKPKKLSSSMKSGEENSTAQNPGMFESVANILFRGLGFFSNLWNVFWKFLGY